MKSVQPFRVAFLVGSDDWSTVATIEAVSKIAGVKIVAVLLDSNVLPLKRRLQNLRRNITREGFSYFFTRLIARLRSSTDELAERAIIDGAKVRGMLRNAFPDRCFNLTDLAAKYGIRLLKVENLNSPECAAMLLECHADLGIVQGTRILKEATFSIPRLGSINVHKGAVPGYRGSTPAFWELFDGASSAGVTIHFVTKQMDAGDIVETGEVAIHSNETPITLRDKLDRASICVLVRAVEAIRTDTAKRRKQTNLGIKPRTKPTVQQRAELRRRLPHFEELSDKEVLLRNCCSLALYYSGLYDFVRKRRKNPNAAILLYQRVKDHAHGSLTVDEARFAAQLLAIRERYPVITSEYLVEKLAYREFISLTSIVVHFDHCCDEVQQQCMPILLTLGIPATAFIRHSGFVSSSRASEHDLEERPLSFSDCTVEHLQQWTSRGFEIGLHTGHNVDSAECELGSLISEIASSRQELERITSKQVTLFSYPFGPLQDIRPEVAEVVRQSGCKAMFTLSKGFVNAGTDLYNMPRISVSFTHNPLWLLMEVENLTFTALISRFRSSMRKFNWVSVSRGKSCNLPRSSRARSR